MADDTVNVTFGAQVDDLVKGGQQVLDVLNDIKDKGGESGKGAGEGFTQLREILQGLTAPIRGIRENLGELADIFVLGFGVEKVAKLVEEMVELGNQTSTTAQILGMSSEEVGRLGAVAALSGTTTEMLASSFERYSVNIQRAQTGTGPASAAIKALGLNAKELLAMPLQEQVGAIADKFAQFANGANKTAIAMALFRNAGMVPVLNEGAKGMEELGAAADRTGTALGVDTVGSLEKIHVAFTEFSLTITGLAASMVAGLSPAIVGVVGSLTDLMQWFGATGSAGGVFHDIMETVKAMVNEAALAIMGLIFVIEGLVQAGAWAVKSLGDVMTGQFAKISKDWDAYNESMLASGASFMKRYNDMMKSVTLGFPGGGVPGQTGAPAPGMDLGADKAGAEMIKNADAQIKVLQEGLKASELVETQKVAQYKETEGEKIAIIRGLVDTEYEAEKAILQNEITSGALSVAQKQEVQNKIREMEAKHATEIVKLNGEAYAAMQKQVELYTNALQSSINGQLRGLLAGTTSFANAFKAITGDMIIFFIEQVEKMVFKWIAAKATELLVTETTETAKTAAVTTGAATGAVAETAAAMAAIQRGVAATFANASAWFALSLGPAAPAAAAGVSAEVEATSVGLMATSAESGAYEVTGGLYSLHDQEAVLPAPAAQAFRDMAESGGIGGSHLHLHGQLIDGPSLQRFARDNAGVFAGALKNFGSLNPSAR
jgi:hypothetical protein